MAHYLSGQCACSEAVARYLLARGSVRQAQESVFIVGADGSPERRRMASRLRRGGFAVEEIAPERAASQYGVEAVPLLEVRDPGGKPRYRGADREHGAPPGQYRDLSILSDLMASRPVPGLRIYGCATGNRLGNLIDPLSLKSLAMP